MKKLFVLLVIAGSMLSVISCRNTARGVVDDTERAVDKVRDATN
jgi:predicted small secreted protein